MELQPAHDSWYIQASRDVIKIQFGYKKIVGEKFLKINLLTNVKGQLMNENLEKWMLMFQHILKVFSKLYFCLHRVFEKSPYFCLTQ